MDNLTLEMLKKQTDMAVDIGEIKVSIKEHIRRTDLLEEQVELNRKVLEKDLAPIKAHVNFINVCLRIFGGIGAFILVLEGVIKIMSFFLK